MVMVIADNRVSVEVKLPPSVLAGVAVASWEEEVVFEDL